jgi:hypothetical protein
MLLPSYAAACETLEACLVDDWEQMLQPGTPLHSRLTALRMMQDAYGWGVEEFDALDQLWERESGWRSTAANPRSTARGIPQAMMSLNPEIATNEWFSSPRDQIDWGLGYINTRYGRPSDALKHHDRKGWY